MRASTDPMTELAGLTAECRSRQEYEAARLEWLERAIGFDTSYVGAATPDAPKTDPLVSGASARYVDRCESQADRYWGDRLVLNAAALRAGGALPDHVALSGRARDGMAFYREIVSGLGIRAVLVSVLRAEGRTFGCLYLGRTSRGARFGREADTLRRALPVLAIGKRLFEPSPAGPPFPPGVEAGAAPLTRREAQVFAHVAQGLTNGEIAALLSISPYTVKNQVASILSKVGARNRTELVYFATRTRVDAPAVGPAAK